MKNKSRILLILELALLAILLGSILFLSLFVQAGGRVYFRGVSSLDLRGQEISPETYDTLSRKLPNCSIVWNVPFQGGLISSTETEVTVTSLTDEEVLLLDYLPQLETVHAEACTDYLQLALLQQRHPECRVLFRMSIGGVMLDQDSETISVSAMTPEELPLLTCFPRLSRAEISGCGDYASLLAYRQSHPDWNLTYTVRLGGLDFPWDSSSVTAENASEEEIVQAFTGLPDLTRLHLVNPQAEGARLVELQQSHPDVEFTWEVDIAGKKADWDATELDISGIPVASCEEVERLVACLPNLEKLIMSDCGIDSETMAQFRERQRDNYKVVWTVYLGSKCKLRTDETSFMPIKQGEYYFLDSDSAELKYCEDMVCMDLGHHMIHNVDFLAYMPHLKYLILAHTGVRDISPITACQELVYLEVDWSEIKDYTPIAELKSLEDLNLNKTACDITPILKMTWLKNLWVPGRGASTREKLLEALPDTRVVLTEPTPEGQGWRNLPNYYAMRDYLEMPYMK